MEFRRLTKLSEEDIVRIETLLDECQKTDDTRFVPALRSVDFSSKNYFFIAEISDTIITFMNLSVYGNNSEGNLWVKPDERNHGISQKMFEFVRKDLKDVTIQNYYMNVESGFLKRNTWFEEKYEVHQTNHLFMQYVGDENESLSKIRLSDVNETNIEEFAEVNRSAFGDEDEEVNSIEFIKNRMKNYPSSNFYAVELIENEKIIGSVVVDDDELAYIYSVAIAESYRGNGYGTQVMREVGKMYSNRHFAPYLFVEKKMNVRFEHTKMRDMKLQVN
jgi:ribosomal protein S18 acetylase RimI-like enzyme